MRHAGEAAADSGNALEVALRFVRAINERRVDTLAELMTADHVFIDSLGRRFQGRETMRKGWGQYYAMFPDYEISCELSLAQGEAACLFGTARGTYQVEGRLPKENHWEIPAAWRAVVREGRVAEWQVYADNGPVLQIIKAACG